MGHYSWFIGARNFAEQSKINWDAVDTEILFKNKVLERCYKKSNTLFEVAKEFDDTKFMGYLDTECIEALVELNKNLIPNGCFPRVYYDYEGINQVWGLEFIPGEAYIHLLMFSYNDLIKTETNSKEDYDKLMNTMPERYGWTVRKLK